MFISKQELTFQNAVSNWLIEQKEVLAYFRYPMSAGDRDFILFKDMVSMYQYLGNVPDATNIIVLKNYCFKLRGIVDPDFIIKACEYIKEKEYMILLPTTQDHYGGEGGEALKKDLEEHFGEKIVLGNYPIWDNPYIEQIEYYKGGIIATAY